MIKRCIFRFKALFRHFLCKCEGVFNKKKKRSKKVTKVIELEALGYVPAPSADCINIKSCKTIR